MNTSIRGDSALLLASAKLVEAGITLLKPVSECLKFDLVLYDSIGFYKVQVKRAYPAKATDKFKISLRRVTMTNKGAVTKTYKKEDTDFIIGVIMENGNLYCLPIDLVSGRTSVTFNPQNIKTKFASNKKIIDAEPYKNVITLHNQIYKL